MSPGREFQAFRYGEEPSAAFDRMRDAVPDYRGLPPEIAGPGSDCLLALAGGQPVGRASMSVVPAMQGVEGPSGLIGHFEALDPDTTGGLLARACTTLARRGVRRVLGPMNGSTWGRYRLALPQEDGAGAGPVPFLGEPVNPGTYVTWFRAAGFAPVASYESRVDESPHEPAGDAAILAGRVADAGIRVRSLEPDRFESELRLLFDLSRVAFAGNPYYTPIEWEPFRAQYAGLRAILRPELVLIAEDGAGRPVAFQLAYLDPLGAAASVPRAVVKTVATHPAVRGMGLAGHMLDLVRARAVGLGAGAVIHALMHVANLSMNMSRRHRSRVFRHYQLFEWRP